MLTGWLALLLFPGFFHATTQAVGSGWRSVGLGVGVLAGMPVAMVVAAITLVGLPISLMLLALYLAAIYLAKIWGWSLPGANIAEVRRRHEAGLAAGTIAGAVHPHYCWLYSVSWWSGPPGRGLPGSGSIFGAALSGITTVN